MKILYYIVWIICIVVAMVSVATITGSLIGFDSIGVKGLTAADGLIVIYNKKRLFALFDNFLKKDK